MKANMIKQYGEKKGKEVYFAKIRGEAVKEAASCDDGNEDKRDQYAKKEIIKNKIRAALGVKNPIVMVASEETIGEAGDEPLEYLPPQIYGDYRGLDRSGKPTKMGGDFQPGGKYGPPKSAPLKQAKATPKSKTA
jgi:hypothetical protein